MGAHKLQVGCEFLRLQRDRAPALTVRSCSSLQCSRDMVLLIVRGATVRNPSPALSQAKNITYRNISGTVVPKQPHLTSSRDPSFLVDAAGTFDCLPHRPCSFSLIDVSIRHADGANATPPVWACNSSHLVRQTRVSPALTPSCLTASGMLDSKRPGTDPSLNVSIDWRTVLGRHDPIWQVGGPPKLICQNVSGVREFVGMYGQGAGGGTACSAGSTDQQCFDELEADCFAKRVCTDDASSGYFGISPAWHANRTSQLFRHSPLHSNSQWNLYLPDTSLPTRRVCVPSTSTAPFTKWEDGPFFGNGLVGGLFLYATASGAAHASDTIAMQVGRVDVWDQRHAGSAGWSSKGDLYNKERLPIGQFELSLPAGSSATWRTSLHNAEVTAKVILAGDGGSLSLRALAPHGEAAGMILELNTSSAALLEAISDPETDAACGTMNFSFAPAVSEWTPGPQKLGRLKTVSESQTKHNTRKEIYRF